MALWEYPRGILATGHLQFCEKIHALKLFWCDKMSRDNLTHAYPPSCSMIRRLDPALVAKTAISGEFGQPPPMTNAALDHANLIVAKVNLHCSVHGFV
jgi:hypothetical protein